MMACLVDEDKIKRSSRPSSRALNNTLFSAWDRLDNKTLDTMEFLQEIRAATAPSNV